ncbi:MAG: hypothetical protein ACXABY_19645 [Candidatus Thorarchaeota archaeon]|jgi:hypothetical protein
MKSLGSIAKYYKFVDPGTQIMLEDEMDVAFNYKDFVRRFCKAVVWEDSHDERVYLAARLALHYGGINTIPRLVKKYPSSVLARPYYLLHLRHNYGDMPMVKVAESIREALDSKPERWIQLDHLLRLWQCCNAFQDVSEMRSAKTGMRILIGVDNDLECFIPGIYHVMMQGLSESESDDSLNDVLKLARKYDDQVVMARLFALNATAVRDTDKALAEKCFLYAREIDADLGLDPKSVYSLSI